MRHTTKHQSAHWAYEVHTFCPVITHSSPSAHGPGLHVGEVGAGVGLRVALAPQVGAVADLGQKALLLLVGAVGDEGRPEQPLPHDVDAGRSVGPHVLLVPDDLLGDGQSPPAVLGRPAHTRPSVGAERALPGGAALAALRAAGPCDPGPGRRRTHPGEVCLEPGPRLGPKGGCPRGCRGGPSGRWRSKLPGRSVSDATLAASQWRQTCPGPSLPGGRCSAHAVYHWA